MAKETKSATIRVKQVKSGISGSPKQRETLRSLGLKRIGHVVEKEDRPEIRGMVAAIPHLVVIEEGE